VSTGLAVRCEGLVHLYSSPDGTEVVALRSVDLHVPAGGRLALIGPSGAGKSTLLALLAGLHRPSAGRLQVGEQELGRLSPAALTAFRAASVGTLLQGAPRNLLPYATAEQNVAHARLALDRRARRRLPPPREVLAGVGATHLAREPVARLSGGEQQRVALAVAMANQPGLLLADEPTSQLDPDGAAATLDALSTVNEQRGTTLVVVTHDPSVGARLGRTVTIRDGRVGAEGQGGEQFAVVSRDGSLQLPQAVRQRWPAGTLLRMKDDGAALVLRPADGPSGEPGAVGPR
jgi:putative ABC transport system ATP-binding protein